MARKRYAEKELEASSGVLGSGVLPNWVNKELK